MDIFEALEQRRAVKHFDSTHQIQEAELGQLMQATLQSPTSFNIQHWRFVLVSDTHMRQAIREAAWDQAQVTEASLLFIMCADLNAWQKDPKRYWQNAPQEAQDILVPMIMPFYEGKEQLQRDEAMRSIGISAQSLMLAAKGMGYDSCPMIGFDQEAVAKLIQLPKDHVIGMMITVGKATKPAWPKPGQLSLDQVLIQNRFDMS